MIEYHTIHFTVGFSSFVDNASSKNNNIGMALMLTVRDLQNLILRFLISFRSQNDKNTFGVNDNYICVVVVMQHNIF